MTSQLHNDNLTPEEYARRIAAGDELLYIHEAAAYVRKSIGTMRYYRHLGTGPRSFRHGRPVAYWRTDLILWLAEEAARPSGRSDGAHALARPQVGRSTRQTVGAESHDEGETSIRETSEVNHGLGMEAGPGVARCLP